MANTRQRGFARGCRWRLRDPESVIAGPDPAIHSADASVATPVEWMPGSSPGMTNVATREV